jgi:hypothetical protein
MWANSDIFKNPPNANNRTLGENSPNLVTLIAIASLDVFLSAAPLIFILKLAV